MEDALPLVDFDSDFLFSELDSLGVTTILMLLSDEEAGCVRIWQFDYEYGV